MCPLIFIFFHIYLFHLFLSFPLNYPLFSPPYSLLYYSPLSFPSSLIIPLYLLLFPFILIPLPSTPSYPNYLILSPSFFVPYSPSSPLSPPSHSPISPHPRPCLGPEGLIVVDLFCVNVRRRRRRRGGPIRGISEGDE